MRVVVLSSLVLFVAFGASGQPSAAMHPHETMNNWGKWGEDDEHGAMNYQSPETVLAGARLIQRGEVFSLAIPIERGGPLFSTRLPPHHFMVSTGADAAVTETPFGFTDDYINMPLQGSTQWDALSHVYYDGAFYNGYPLNTVTSEGAQKLGIDKVRDRFVGRAVLIDIVRYKGGELEPGYGITREDIEGALDAQDSEVKRGDMVVIRTGAVPHFYASGPQVRQNWQSKQTGITKSVIPWIKEMEISAIAADNLGIEQSPNPDGQDWSLHGNILRDLGVFIGEIWWLEELAADCARDGRYEFFLSAPPLNIPGAVGSPLNPIAVK